jgi:hypothetical protein
MERKIVTSERIEGRFRRGIVLHRCTLECGHTTRCRGDEVRKGKTICMDCYFEEAKETQ